MRRPALRRVLLALAATALGLLVLPELHAQSQATTGIIRGTVTDASGQSVPGASVVLRNTQTNISRTTTTNERGIFVAALLPVGTYDVTARSPGAAEARHAGVALRLGETVNLTLQLGAIQLAAIDVTGGAAPVVDPSRVEASTRLLEEVVRGLPNNGRNFLNFALLTPNVAIVQGPDGDELTVSGQRGIYNNVSVDGADFNNPFFGEQRGGQRPAFTFNLDAVQEMVVVANGANAEFGRSAGGFVNVLTRSGTNQMHGSAHYYGQADALSAAQFRNQGSPDFTQHQFGFTLGGPIRRDRAFFFIAYDQQVYDQTKQTLSLPERVARQGGTTADTVAARRLVQFADTAFSAARLGDWGPIRRTNNANALLVKIDWRLSPTHSFSLKYNYTNSRQENGTFDVDTWARSAGAIERDYSHAINGSLVSLLSPSMTNEFRFQYAREDRPRPYEGPGFPGTSGTLFNTGTRPFPDTGVDFGFGYRWGMPFFIPIEAYDTRVQVLDNLTVLRGNHLFKLGAEYNRTFIEQTFIGFANERFIFGSVNGFLNYVAQGPGYAECSDGSTALYPATPCPAGTTITGPLAFYLQLAPVQAGQTARNVGNQSFAQHEIAVYAQDSWKPRPNLTVNYGLRWEAQIQPDPITPPGQVFYQPFIGQTRFGQRFPSDGTIPSDWGMFQPRLGIAWDVDGDGRQVVRASTGLYYARTPGLVFASTRTGNGSIGRNVFRASFFNGFGLTPPVYGPTLPVQTAGTPDHPDINVTAEDFQNPRTFAVNLGYERRLTRTLAGSVSYNFAATDNLNRFVNRNDPLLGNGTVGPWSNGLPATAGAPTGPADTLNGISAFTSNASGLIVLESTAKSRYHGFTVSLNGSLSRRFQFQANYTLSFDKTDDDNERDPFTYRYARVNALDTEYNWSDRDQRHRVNAWFLARAPWGVDLNNRISYYSAQPTSETCGANNQGTGTPAATPQSRICANGTVLLRNTIRKDNAYFQWDLRASRAFPVGSGQLEAILEVFNLLNTFNFRNPSAPALLFNFDGTIRSGLGDPRRVQVGARWIF